MLIAGIAAFCAGALEFFLNTLLFPAVFAGNIRKTLLTILVKLALYGVGIWLLIAFFRAYLIGAAVGFGAGFLIYLIVYAVIKTAAKGG